VIVPGVPSLNGALPEQALLREHYRSRSRRKAPRTSRFAPIPGRAVFFGGKKDHQREFTIDPAESPKHIDMTRQFEDRKDTFPGIYKIDGDTLKLCVDDFGRDRPAEFKTTKDTPSHSLLVFKRAKP